MWVRPIVFDTEGVRAGNEPRVKRILIAFLGLVAACSSSSNDDASNGGGAAAGGGGGSSSLPGSSTGNPANDAGGQSIDAAASSSTRSACKRGVAYGHHSTADLRALSKSVTWWYNWTFVPDDGVKDTFKSLDVEYVPMVWGANVDLAQVGAGILPGETTLLGFNEPNFGSQSNLSAKDAASRWPKIQAVADAHGLKLLSPAVNFCGGNCQNTDPFAYLADFLSSCAGCRVDALAVHLYVGCQGANGNKAQYMIDHLKTYESKFTQPLWLTEFACDDAKSDDDQKAFLVDAVKYLESDPRIARYAFFSGRADNVGHASLLGADGQLTSIGQAYVDAPAACQ